MALGGRKVMGTELRPEVKIWSNTSISCLVVGFGVLGRYVEFLVAKRWWGENGKTGRVARSWVQPFWLDGLRLGRADLMKSHIGDDPGD